MWGIDSINFFPMFVVIYGMPMLNENFPVRFVEIWNCFINIEMKLTLETKVLVTVWINSSSNELVRKSVSFLSGYGSNVNMWVLLMFLPRVLSVLCRWRFLILVN